MKHRIKAKMIWQVASGMAAWCEAQMAVRYTQSVYIRQGDPEEEAPFNEADTSGNPHVFTCDLILGNEAAAIDAFNTLTSASLMAWLEDTDEVSYVEHHKCYHDESNQSCEIVHRKEYQNQALTKEIINGTQ